MGVLGRSETLHAASRCSARGLRSICEQNAWIASVNGRERVLVRFGFFRLPLSPPPSSRRARESGVGEKKRKGSPVDVACAGYDRLANFLLGLPQGSVERSYPPTKAVALNRNRRALVRPHLPFSISEMKREGHPGEGQR